MITEKRKQALLDAMEAAMELSGIYLKNGKHEIANFRYGSDPACVVFDFGFFRPREGYIEKAHFTIFLDEDIESENGDNLFDVFEFISDELDRFEKPVKGYVNSDYMGKEECR